MALDSAGKLLAVASDDGRTLLWNLGTMKSTPIEHGGIGSVTIALSADGTRLASSDSNGVVRIWNTSTGQKMRDDIPSGPQSFQLEFAEDGARLLVNRNKNLSLWDTKQGEKPLWKANDIEGITLSSVKKEIAATTSDGSIVFLSLADGKEQFRLPASEVEKLGKSEKSGDQLSSSEIEKLGARTASIYSPDGNRLILGYSDGSIRSIKLDLDTWTRRACAIANREISPSEKIAHQLFADRVWSFFNPRSYLWPEPPICG